ncbi:MAG: hypothetical protein ACLFPQ_03850 [Candidatus Woesearchaeota archaeon]
MNSKIMSGMVLIFVMFISVPVFAEELVVEKVILEDDISVGKNLTFGLRFLNPYGKQVELEIVDKNVVDGSGMDIQCLEYLLPPEPDVVVAYSPIFLQTEGQFEVDSATVTYTDPDTGEEKKTKSNRLSFEVLEGSAKSVRKSEITTVYQCNGHNIQSTSSSSMQIKTEGSQNNDQKKEKSSIEEEIQTMQEQMQQQMQQEQQTSGSQRVQNNQLNQDANALKNQMQKEMQKMQEMQREFEENIASSQEFRKEHQKLTQQGFNLTEGSLNPETNSTGDFEFTYQDESGDEMKMAGRMENNTMKELEVEKIIFEDDIPEEEDERKISWWVALLALGIVAIYIVSKNKNTDNILKKEEVTKQEFDYRKEALSILDSAVKSWDKGLKKDAFMKVSSALRFYYIHDLDIKKESTNSEIVNFLKSTAHGHMPVKRCLDLCSLVEFAKKDPTEKEFKNAENFIRKKIGGK